MHQVIQSIIYLLARLFNDVTIQVYFLYYFSHVGYTKQLSASLYAHCYNYYWDILFYQRILSPTSPKLLS
jgi:hypothetical protein